MAKVSEEEEIDSQILAENIGFLDNCFDNSFVLQSSLVAVKEYVAEEKSEGANEKNIKKSCKKINSSLQNNTLSLDASTCNKSIVSQCTVNNNVLNKNLKDWGLPLEIARKYEQRGIIEMFDWQVTCLGNPKVLLDCRNLVYSAPTSAGKTLVAEILTIKTILERQKKVIIILPFVSIVREKMFYLQDILSNSGIRVEGFMGSQSPPGGLQAVHVAICTIEKANSLVNKLLDEGNISELGAVIVDELHLLGDPHRGYILELLLTKIKYVTIKSNNVLIQIVGMSATLPNLEVLAEWLEAELYITQFRPIPLDEFCLVGNKYYDKQGIHITSIANTKMGNDECDNVLRICLETIRDGCSILIFCMTKNRCENLAQSISSSFYKLGCNGCEFGVVLRNQLKSESILEVLEQLKNCPVGLDAILQKTISFGVAYHHAGLTFDERDIIEGGFKSGAIRVLVATSTLSSGVNLPARKVIVRSPVFLRQPINILTYKQMVGRAGRMGKDSKGESILICTEAEKKIGFELMMGALDPVKSCIESEDKYMRAVLEMIASQVLCTKAELELYTKCTLLFTQQTETPLQNFLLEDTLKELKNFELVRNQNDDDGNRYVATPLGKACLSSSMAPNDGLSLFCELQKARQCLVLETDLHLIYLVTPYSVSSQWGDSIDWLHLLTLWESLTKAMKRVGELVGVQESFIIRCLRGTKKLNNLQNKLNIHKRFYTALALQDLVNEVPLSEVAEKFQCARGFLQGLQQAAATFAGMVTAFCRQLGWKNMEMLISQFQDRLHFGIHSELLEIMKLPSLNGTRARALFDSGFDTISSIASAESDIIENILHKAVPFQSEKEREGDDTDDMRKRNKIKSIWVTGCCGMTAKEAAENLITEARKYLELELRVTDIKWNKMPLNCDNAGSNTEKEMNDDENSSTHYVKQENDISKIKNNDLLIKAEPVTQNKNEFNTLGDLNKNSEHVFNITIADTITTIKDGNVMDNKINQSNKKMNNTSTSTTLAQNRVDTENISIVKERNQIILKNTHIKNSDTVNNEVIWDTLNITEAAFENISKLQTTDKVFSPNMSFGDTEDKFVPSVNISDNTALSKCNSVKDVSLFSSDGDNSSLFDESLPLDLIPSKLIDDKNEVKFGSADYSSINTNSILNAFKSTLIEIDDDDEDIKLVYEEDDGLNENIRDSSGSKHTKAVEVEDTQVVNETFDNLKFQSPFKRQLANNKDTKQPSPKKKKVESKWFHKPDYSFKVPASKITCAPSNNIVISINKYKINCYSLRENEIVENLHIVENLQAASIYLHIKNTSLTTNELIGSNVLKNNDLLIKAEPVTQNKNEFNTLGDLNKNSEHVFNITIADTITTIKDGNVMDNKINQSNKKMNNTSTSTTLAQNRVDTENISIVKERNQIILKNTHIKNSDTVNNEVIWDTLNITEAAFENISKLQTTDKVFSPNMSFGDTEDKFVPSVNISDNTALSKCNSVKDVSLFSSDGDNSSLFDESLPLDLIPSKLIDDKNEVKFGSADYSSINTNSILNAFKSTLIEIDDDDEDIKLVYEEDDGLNENIRDSSGSKHTKAVEVEDTQVVNETFDNLKFQSPFKRQLANNKDTKQPSPKKKKVESKWFHKPDYSFKVPASKITCAPSNNIVISINKYKINCYSLRENEIVENLHIVENLQAASIYLHIKNTSLTTNELIGSNVLKVPKTSCKDLNEERFAVKGMAICFGKSTCIYMDFSLVGEMLRIVKDGIRRWLNRKTLKLTMLSLKTYYIHIKRWLGTNLPLPCVDVSIAEWLTNSDEKIPNIICLAKKYCETDLDIPIKVGNQHKKFQNLDTFEDLCVRAYFVRLIADKQQEYLTERYLSVRETMDVETQVTKILSGCEFYGITVDKNLASRLLIDVKNSQDILQKKAYKLCGHHFNFNSSKDVAKVLGIYKGSKVSTKKSILTTHNSPMSSIVIYWRKLNSILTKTLYPLTEKACIYSEGDRINPSYTMYTCTGRISMHEPNLQNVPRTFSIPAQYLSMNDDICDGDVIEFNCRNIFRVTPGFVIVSADYCQLEMRILTHYSKDPVLMSIMCSNVDVFKSIAASWSNVPENQVDDDLRQKAKQLCYGILYGMGNRTLSQHLDVSETEAAVFMDSFYKTYPAVKEYTASVIVECRKKEYVETLKNRRRYLPDINSNIPSKKSAAERQAVNTTIQGSAADIAKAAMCAIDNRTDLHEPKTRLILQMHDELIYEVPENNKNSFIAMMKEVMEDTVRLNVPLPVRVKCGYTWGTLEEVKV